MIEGIIGGLIASAFVAVGYGIFFAQREDQIRKSIALKRTGRFRKKYIKCLISSIQGDGHLLHTKIAGITSVTVLFIVGMVFFLLSIDLDNLIESNNELIIRAEALVSGVAAPAQKTNSPEEVLQQLQNRAQEVHILLWTCRAIAIITFCLYTYFTFTWASFIVLRRLVSFRHERLIQRLQGIASKEELAELALTEIKVEDEETVNIYIKLALRIAFNHGVSGLVSPLDVWCDAQCDSKECNYRSTELPQTPLTQDTQTERVTKLIDSSSKDEQ